jgi:hypothetical protein
LYELIIHHIETESTHHKHSHLNNNYCQSRQWQKENQQEKSPARVMVLPQKQNQRNQNKGKIINNRRPVVHLLNRDRRREEVELKLRNSVNL